MIIALIGHRGVGKTSLLKRLSHYFKDQNAQCLDLDLEIEAATGKSVSDIFSHEGEVTFRKYEQECFEKLMKQNVSEAQKTALTFLALGAGFNTSLLLQMPAVLQNPADLCVVNVQRRTDSDGRIFLDRPRLLDHGSDLEEYAQKKLEREPQFYKHKDFTYIIPEGLENPDFIEKSFFEEIISIQQNPFQDFSRALGGGVTLQQEHLKNSIHWLSALGLDFLEVRDDLFAEKNQVWEKVIELFPSEKILYAFRDKNLNPDERLQKIEDLSELDIWWDWAWELGEPPAMPSILSFHDFAMSEFSEYENIFTHWEQEGAHIKLSPFVQNYTELKTLLDWQIQAPETRSILPRSESGRWNWFRLYMIGRQLINFWRDAQGSASDQPTYYEWAAVQSPMISKPVNEFAAVLGHPVYHSRTPLEHQMFFADFGWPVWAIDIQKDEFISAMEFLELMGLQAAAVTSPLKIMAAEKTESLPEKNKNSINTLLKAESGWLGANTDYMGLVALIKEIQDPASAVVWGGGGVLGPLYEIVPEASFYSSTSGLKKNHPDQNIQPEYLIWAAAEGNQLMFPPEDWQPKWVFDLNYRENSSARIYVKKLLAKNPNVHYVSGLEMFKVQAEWQRNFWSEN